MNSKLIGLKRARRELAAKPDRVLADFRAESALVRWIKDEFDALARGSRERLNRAKERAQPAPAASCPELSATAMKAALAAYDEAFKAPSIRGLPSHAAVIAYLDLLPEREGAIRAKLQAALLVRQGQWSLASTTSVQESGLLDAILPTFTRQTGVKVHVLALGTGQALEAARRGDAGVVLVHDPEAEQEFIDEGHGIDRRQIAWNDFVIVGPKEDPARLAGGREALPAFQAIATTKSPFISRGDRSGTNALELRLWKAAAIDPQAGGHTWHRAIGAGMGQTLCTAAALAAYTLTDRGTWVTFKNKGPLEILVEGDPRLLNRYDVIQLNPTKHGTAKLEGARKLAEWLVSSAGQEAIGAYQVQGQQLFHSSAAAPR
jgi:tungstate transport system substrate-binding protein